MKVEMDIYEDLEQAEVMTNEKLDGKRNAKVFVKMQGDGRILVVITYIEWGKS